MNELEDELLNALQSEDDLGVVIRSHIYIESLINNFISTVTPCSEYIEKINMDFSDKILLAIGLGLDEDLKKPLSVLANIRNAFAHKPKSHINKSDTNNLYKSFSSIGKKAIQITYAKATEKHEIPKKFSDLIPKDQFILIILALRGTILVTTTQYENIIKA